MSTSILLAQVTVAIHRSGQHVITVSNHHHPPQPICPRAHTRSKQTHGQAARRRDPADINAAYVRRRDPADINAATTRRRVAGPLGRRRGPPARAQRIGQPFERDERPRHGDGQRCIRGQCRSTEDSRPSSRTVTRWS
jgi:hypothetical protein